MRSVIAMLLAGSNALAITNSNTLDTTNYAAIAAYEDIYDAAHDYTMAEEDCSKAADK